jgi:hypothetical protein
VPAFHPAEVLLAISELFNKHLLRHSLTLTNEKHVPVASLRTSMCAEPNSTL